MKLSEWAKTQGISYLTAWRWFNDGKLPVEAYQSESGTIIVKDASDTLESPMPSNNQSNDSMSIFLKKTVEFSKNNASVEDFAAYILSNFDLKLNNVKEPAPKYSKNKPKPEDVQKHFNQFLKSDGSLKPKPNMFLTDSNTLEQLGVNEEAGEGFSTTIGSAVINSTSPQDIQSLVSDLAAAIATPDYSTVKIYDSLGGNEGVVSRSPQSINYTNSTDPTFTSLNSSPSFGSVVIGSTVQPSVANIALSPSLNEIEKAHQAANKLAADLRGVVRAKRGRKPSKKAETK